jgi:exodeoxyribonuclease VII large subunit
LPDAPYIKLSELTGQLAKLINVHFSNKTFWVIAEISNLKFYPGKNYYFLDLVEKDPFTHAVLTSIKANAWSSAHFRIRSFEQETGQKFDNNISVLLKVSVEYHITYGLKLNILDVDTAWTIGSLEKQRQDILVQLVQQNPGFIHLEDGAFITYNKGLPLNPVVQRIALIASPDSDGYRDFKHELDHNAYGYRFYVKDYPAQVQGAGMEAGIINRLVEIFTGGKQYDAVAIVRGGGAQTDLLIFDSYELSRAVAKFPIPVFTGIGHTRNESIVDMMAFSSSKTPTKVAASIIAHNRTFEETIFALQKTIITKTNEALGKNQLILSQLKAVLSDKSKDILHSQKLYLDSNRISIKEMATQQISAASQELQQHQFILQRSALTLLSSGRQRLDHYRQLVKHLSPESVLKRGYALVYRQGKLVTDVAALKAGEEITTLLATGSIQSTIKDISIHEQDPEL